ncbi:MAG: glycosyltransferase family 4 protein [Bacteroidota bacterium]
MLAGQPHILFTATFHSSFIDEDIQILRKDFDVTVVVAKGWKAPILLIQSLFKADVTFSWFASVYSSFLVFLAHLFGKKAVLVLGGVDVAKEKDLQYGIWNSWWKSPLIRYGITHASRVLAVDDFLKREAERLAYYSGDNIVTVPTGYDAEFWKPSGNKEQLVLTVASCPDMLRVKLKGIDLFISIARKLPEIQFKIIGISQNVALSLNIPKNVECVSFSHREKVRQSYQRAKVYCQLSYREGLPNALCEAMLCECVPVGTTVGGIPTAIGDSGFLVDYLNEKQIVQAIRDGLGFSSELGKRARLRIASQFTLSQREQKLKEIIAELVQ